MYLSASASPGYVCVCLNRKFELVKGKGSASARYFAAGECFNDNILFTNLAKQILNTQSETKKTRNAGQCPV